MGGTGTYRGTSSQNLWMIQQMKAHGFKQGGTIGKAIASTKEDGFVLARTGEKIIPLNLVSDWNNLIESLPSLNAATNLLTNIPKMSGNTSTASIDNLTITFDLPNVTNSDELINTLQRSKKFENVIKETISSSMLGGNSLSKYKIK